MPAYTYLFSLITDKNPFLYTYYDAYMYAVLLDLAVACTAAILFFVLVKLLQCVNNCCLGRQNFCCVTNWIMEALVVTVFAVIGMLLCIVLAMFGRLNLFVSMAIMMLWCCICFVHMNRHQLRTARRNKPVSESRPDRPSFEYGSLFDEKHV